MAAKAGKDVVGTRSGIEVLLLRDAGAPPVRPPEEAAH
jgi:hypothetical protein